MYISQTTKRELMKEKQQKVKRNRTQRCLTFNDDTFVSFQDLCKKRDAVPSRVLERFMDKQVRAI